MGELITFVGLDVHKQTITVALAESGKRDEVREYGRIANTAEALKRLLFKLTRLSCLGTGTPMRSSPVCAGHIEAGRAGMPASVLMSAVSTTRSPE